MDGILKRDLKRPWERPLDLIDIGIIMIQYHD